MAASQNSTLRSNLDNFSPRSAILLRTIASNSFKNATVFRILRSIVYETEAKASTDEFEWKMTRKSIAFKTNLNKLTIIPVLLDDLLVDQCHFARIASSLVLLFTPTQHFWSVRF